MNSIAKFFTSSPGKKYLMSLTGLGLFVFLIGHLLGNLQLLIPSDYYFNKYAYHLESLKPLVILAEIGLLILIGIHIVVSLACAYGARQARPDDYKAPQRTKGGESHMNLSSTNMLILGIFVLIFIVVHVWQFKYGPGRNEGYSYSLSKRARVEAVQAHTPGKVAEAAAAKSAEVEEDVRDLYLLVVRTFAKPGWMLAYVGFMLFLGFHLRHGVWSAFQSLGAMPGKFSKSLYFGGAIFGALIAVGFLILPVWIFFAVNVLKLIKI